MSDLKDIINLFFFQKMKTSYMIQRLENPSNNSITLQKNNLKKTLQIVAKIKK